MAVRYSPPSQKVKAAAAGSSTTHNIIQSGDSVWVAIWTSYTDNASQQLFLGRHGMTFPPPATFVNINNLNNQPVQCQLAFIDDQTTTAPDNTRYIQLTTTQDSKQLCWGFTGPQQGISFNTPNSSGTFPLYSCFSLWEYIPNAIHMTKSDTIYYGQGYNLFVSDNSTAPPLNNWGTIYYDTAQEYLAIDSRNSMGNSHTLLAFYPANVTFQASIPNTTTIACRPWSVTPANMASTSGPTSGKTSFRCDGTGCYTTYSFVGPPATQTTIQLYDTAVACQAAPGNTLQYQCLNGLCQLTLTNSTAIGYPTLSACQTATKSCTITPSNAQTWSKNVVTGVCVPDANGTLTLSQCQQQPSAPQRYNCVNGECVPNINGTYNSLAECQTNCADASNPSQPPKKPSKKKNTINPNILVGIFLAAAVLLGFLAVQVPRWRQQRGQIQMASVQQSDTALQYLQQK